MKIRALVLTVVALMVLYFVVGACALRFALILESNAPLFSSAVRLRLNERWYLIPMTLLPISRLFAHDYSLTDVLSSTPEVSAVVFQGTADSETPLSVLRTSGMPCNLKLVVVSSGSHSTTYLLARDRMVKTTLSMIRLQRRSQ